MGEAKRKNARGLWTPGGRHRDPFEGKKLVIGLPAYWFLPFQFVASLASMWIPENTSVATIPDETEIATVSMAYIDLARNEIIKRAHKMGAHWILFLDQDMTFPPDLFVRLAAHRKPIVSGLYFNKIPPHNPLIFDWVAEDRIDTVPRLDYEEGLLQCGAVGMGVTLVEMSAIDKIIQWQIDQGDSRPMPFRVNAPIGEDIWMCAHARAAGVPVYVDTTVKCGHVGMQEITETHHRLVRQYGSLENVAELLHHAEESLLTNGQRLRPAGMETALTS